MQFQIPKGLFDILPYGEDLSWKNSNVWQHIESVMRQTAHDYGFMEVRTPIFEKTELFCRGVGATSDIASKELYTFLDKAGRSMSLRPEGTASIMRCFIEKNLNNLRKTHKFFYIAPMFRYDRPQAGRYRQHHQFGVEALGSNAIEQDAEIIDLLMQFLFRAGLKNLTVKINFLGNENARASYKESLKKYLQPHFESLTADSKVRFEKNILRILDSKDDQDKIVLKNAPVILNFLSAEEHKSFDHLCSLLQKLKISFAIDPFLVRGLDYYDKTVFEVVNKNTGAQNSLGGGGRYDSLLKSLGGPDMPGCGFGSGIERILQTMQEEKVEIPMLFRPLAYFIPLDESSKTKAFEIVSQLRHDNIAAEIDCSCGKIGAAIKEADKKQALFVIIIGEEELRKEVAMVKNLQTRDQQMIPFDKLALFLKS